MKLRNATSCATTAANAPVSMRPAKQTHMCKFTKALFTAGTLLAVVLLPAKASAAQMENRFLFVIDTSSAMRSRTNGIQDAVVGLLKSDMHGQLRKGDTIGLWTYNDALHDGFPRQVWSEKDKDAIISDVKRYLNHEHYEKRAHLEKALRAIGQVIQASERLTIIFVYDGSQPIRGTPFDDDINGLQKQSSRMFRTAHLPMVTVLVAHNGQVYDYTINNPDAVKIPITSLPLPPPETNAPTTNAIAAAPVSTVPVPTQPHRHIEIVMHGSNTVAATPTNIVAETTPAPLTAPVVVTPIASNPPPSPSIAVASAPPPVAENPSTNQPETPVQAAAGPAPTPEMAPAPVSTPTPPPPPSTANQIALFVIAISLLTIAIVLVIFLVRRSRSHSQPSLISQSTDRKQ
ncbi:MAG TPA: hypothetical protein VH619_00835 [Verrucomicrobiae bacterium]|nr:hypothetical protein [Verrucomicrobiae bacterium]